MSSEIEITETPNWLKELEAKREKRLRTKLGHELGAGAPCLQCEDKCPGLDLHFWRKICKNCKCSKEEHQVEDEDIYGWAKEELLGTKPSKLKRKIVLPGRQDEVELDWAPSGQKETIDKYLKTLPTDLLPIKGSQAAQDRKQLLKKQIPIHDIDPTLCHDLTEDELKQMQEYIAHLKEKSVGVGQLVQMNLQKGTKHTINKNDAMFLINNIPKGIGHSDNVTLQNPSKVQNLDDFANLSVKEKNKLLNLQSNTNYNPEIDEKQPTKQLMKDIKYPMNLHNKIPSKNVTPSENQQNPNEIKYNNISAKMFEANNERPNDWLKNINVKNSVPTGFTPFKNKNETMYGKSNISVDNSEKLSHAELSYPHDFIKNQTVKSNLKYADLDFPCTNEKAPENIYEEVRNPNDKNKQYGGLTGDKYVNLKNYESSHFKPISVDNRDPASFGSVKDVHYDSNVPKNSLMQKIHQEAIKNHEDVRNPFIGKYKDIVYDENNSSVNNPYYLNEANLKRSQLPYLSPEERELYEKSQFPMQNAEDSRLESSKPNDEKLGNLLAKDYKIYENNQNPVLNRIKTISDENIPLSNLTREQLKLLENEVNPTLHKFNDINYDTHINHRENLTSQDDRFGNIPDNIPLSNLTREQLKLLENEVNPTLHKFNDINYDPLMNHRDNLTSQDDRFKNIPLSNLTREQLKLPENEVNPTLRKFNDINYDTHMNHRDNLTTQDDRFKNIPLSNLTREQLKLLENEVNPTLHKFNDINYDTHMNHRDDVTGDRLSHVSNTFDSSYQNPKLNSIKDLAYSTFDSNEYVDDKNKKNLPSYQPQGFNSKEDLLQPQYVPVGAINDVYYEDADVKQALMKDNNIFEGFEPTTFKPDLQATVLPKCHFCKEHFAEHEIAVSIPERSDAVFHTKCFKCFGCNQVLADMIYFYDKESGDIYCCRDFAKIRGIPRCAACDELIFVKEYCLAENATFHIKHFCCFECDKPLAGQNYVVENTQPVCLPCFEETKANKCLACKNVIRPDEQGLQLKDGVHFHASDDCFSCKVCRKSLFGAKLLFRNERLYCSHDCFNSDA